MSTNEALWYVIAVHVKDGEVDEVFCQLMKRGDADPPDPPNSPQYLSISEVIGKIEAGEAFKTYPRVKARKPLEGPLLRLEGGRKALTAKTMQDLSRLISYPDRTKNKALPAVLRTRSVELSPSNRRIYLLLELEQAVECLRTGLERIKHGRTVLRDDMATLFLLANGLERYLKGALHVLHHEKHGDFASTETMRNYGHEVISLSETVIRDGGASVRTNRQIQEDLAFVQSDALLREILSCLDAFAGMQRYFLLDGVSGAPVDPEGNPKALWEEVLREVADDSVYVTAEAGSVVSTRLIYTIQRYLRCVGKLVDGSTERSRFLSTEMGPFYNLSDDDLKVPCKR